MSNSNSYTKTKKFFESIQKQAKEYADKHLGSNQAPNLTRISATPKRKQENPDNQPEI